VALEHLLLNIRSLPHFLQQLIVRNQAPGIVDQKTQDIEGPRLQLDTSLVPGAVKAPQALVDGIQPEGGKFFHLPYAGADQQSGIGTLHLSQIGRKSCESCAPRRLLRFALATVTLINLFDELIPENQ
jgi:hypothetical protein